jgi:uncharacterized membrane protein
MAFCSKCGTQIPEGAGSCPVCKTSVDTAGSGNTAMAGGQTSGIQSNVAALLSYVVIIGIVFLIVEPFKSDKFVRFHAFQSIFYWIAVLVIFMLIGLVFPLSIWILVYWPLRLLTLVGMAFLMFKAYNNERYKLPYIGDLAEKQV